jgi:hypothetical protein
MNGKAIKVIRKLAESGVTKDDKRAWYALDQKSRAKRRRLSKNVDKRNKREAREKFREILFRKFQEKLNHDTRSKCTNESG